MKTRISVFVMTLALGMLTCQAQSVLEPDRYLSEVFTKQEIVEIEKMVRYADNRMAMLTGETDFARAYHVFFDRLAQSQASGGKWLIPFCDDEKYAFIESLDTTVAKEFWRITSTMRSARYQGKTYRNLENFRSLRLNHGRYLNYIEYWANEDPFFQEVVAGIEVSGDFPTSQVAYFPTQHHKFDFEVPRYRLWAAVFVLSLEEHFDDKMERYLNKNKP